ncbi:MAG: hypothetical protein JSV89_21500 [Spirochaetaceae bacterium]|nr:MAG: hypothetical protein JSV89_21500 [Spirochaetaceae bacterium]
MKFKTIYILFNAVILLSFGFIFLMPLLLLGSDYFALFVSKNWIAGALFLLTLIIINGYFLGNWKLFRLLESEDWRGLIHLLEQRVYQKGSCRRGAIKMLINAYVVTSSIEKISDLETHLREKKPALLRTFALQFGIPYLLNMKDDPKSAETYFGRAAERKDAPHRDWLRWSYASCLLLQRQFDAAKVTLLELHEDKLDPVLELLTLHGLSFFAGVDPQLAERVERERRSLAQRYTAEQWDKKIESNSKHIQIMLFNAIIRDAKSWLFDRSADGLGRREAGDSGSPSASPNDEEKTIN